MRSVTSPIDNFNYFVTGIWVNSSFKPLTNCHPTLRPPPVSEVTHIIVGLRSNSNYDIFEFTYNTFKFYNFHYGYLQFQCIWDKT